MTRNDISLKSLTSNLSILANTTAVVLCCAPLHGAWKPVEGAMLTEWGKNLNPQKVWQEYPRPQLVRSGWTCLNGFWSYAITGEDVKAPGEWDGEILVPFAPEAALSGVGRLLEPDQVLWYRRSLAVSPKEGEKTLLHFEAVDYRSTIWLNGEEVGHHRGGNTPFSFDVSEFLQAGVNELVVRVDDDTNGFQLHGKQALKPGGIWYTRVSGIWQTVWMEQVPGSYIEDLDFACDIAEGTLTVSADVVGSGSIRVTASFSGKEVAAGSGAGEVTLEIPSPQLWSPEAPNLYDLEVELVDGNGATVDKVSSYAALREFGKERDANGNLRFTLNGESYFHWGPLDQGWWPDGLLTPPSDEAMVFDVEFLKKAGFNMIRKHIKVEPRRYYAHLDRIGMLMWQDQVSMGFGPHTEPSGSNPRWTRMAPNPRDGEWPDEDHEQFVLEYKRMVEHLRDHPCIAVWVPFNEAWGQHRTMEVGKMAVALDPTRHINIASGGNFWPVGDIADEHAYPHPAFPLTDDRFGDFVKVVGEFGGHGWPVEGHLWKKDNRNWGYGGLPKDIDEWKERFVRSIEILASLRKRGVAGGVYTQTTDVEVEINGLLTYDRIPKVDPEWLAEQSRMLLDTPDVVNSVVVTPAADREGVQWAYTLDGPGSGWEKPGFDASSWVQGTGGFGTRETPNAVVGTVWDSSEIWIRREFTISEALEGDPVLRIFHDEDAEVFLNGKKIASLAGYTSNYAHVPIEDRQLLKVGRNVLAIHCRQTRGGQFIDAGVEVEMAHE